MLAMLSFEWILRTKCLFRKIHQATAELFFLKIYAFKRVPVDTMRVEIDKMVPRWEKCPRSSCCTTRSGLEMIVLPNYSNVFQLLIVPLEVHDYKKLGHMKCKFSVYVASTRFTCIQKFR